jgi:hypothetical protein
LTPKRNPDYFDLAQKGSFSTIAPQRTRTILIRETRLAERRFGGIDYYAGIWLPGPAQ